MLNTYAVKQGTSEDAKNTSGNIKQTVSIIAEEEALEKLNREQSKNIALTNAGTASDAGNSAGNVVQGASNAGEVGLGDKLKGIWGAIPVVGKAIIIIAAILGTLVAIAKTVETVKEKELEKIKEKAEEAKAAINNLKSSFKDTKKTTEDIAERFAELSQGIDDFTGKNVSLSTEEYEEFLNLSNQLADLFPSLSRTYDENGNAIVNLSGDVNTVVSSLQQLLDVERELANQEIADKLPEVYAGAKVKVDEYKEELAKEKEQLDFYNTAKEQQSKGRMQQAIAQALKDENFKLGVQEGTITISREMYGDDYDKVYSEYFDILKASGLLTGNYAAPDKYELYLPGDGGDNFIQSKKDVLLGKYNEKTQQIQRNINKLESKVNNEWASLSNNLMSGIQTDGNYKMLNDSAQAYVQNAIGNLDYDALVKEFGGDKKGYEKLQEYIQDNVLGLFKNSEVQTLTTQLFSLDFSNMSSEEIKSSIMEYINKIVEVAESLDIEGVDSSYLLKVFGLEGHVTVADNFNKVKDQIARDIVGVKDGELMDKVQSVNYNSITHKIDQFADEYSINTQNELAAFNDSWEKANGDIDKAFELYLQQLNEKDKKKSFNEVFNAESFSEQKEELLDLAKAGELTPETLKSTKEYEALLEQTGLTAESCKDKIYNLLTAQQKLAGANTGLDKLKSSYEEFVDLGFVTAQTLEELPEQFKKLDGFNVFSKIAGDKEKGIDEIQKAFNDLVKEYLIFTQTLNEEDLISDDLETQQRAVRVYADNLRNMGIVNADEVVQQTVDSLKKSEKLFDDAETEYRNYLDSKTYATQEFLNSETTYNSQLVKMMGAAYKTDYDNWVESLTAKNTAYSDYLLELSRLNDGWTGTDADGNIIAGDELKKRLENGDYFAIDELFRMGYNTVQAQNIMKAQSAYQFASQNSEKFKNDLKAKYTFKESDFEFKYDGSGMGSGSGSDSTFDWIETKLSNLNEQLEKTKETAQDAFSGWSVRSKSYDEAENKIKHLIGVQEEAKSRYLEEANKSGLSEPYKILVQEGKIDITKLTESAKDQKLAEQIQSYQEWYEKAKACGDEVDQLNKDLDELYRDSRTFRWEVFDNLVDAISRVTEETEYLIELLSEEDLFDANGNMTEYATATLGLHLSNIETYKQLAKDQLEEIQSLEAEVNKEGADQETIDRYNELIDAHRDNISAIKDEETAILDLVEQGYQKQLEALQEIIEKKKESLNAEKSLYDYQKSIEEKTKNVTSLRKQYEVYKNDDSEEGIAQAQRIKLELEKAEEDLKQTEYEKYLSDQEAMFDQLTSDYEEWMNNRLDDENRLLEEIRDKISGESDSILSTLKEIADKNDTVISNDITTAITEGTTTAINNIADAIIDALNSDERHLGNIGERYPEYASGTKRSGKGWAWTQEKGVELIRTKDGSLLTPLDNSMVFNNESSRRLWEFSQNPVDYLNKLGMQNVAPQINVVTPKMPELSRVSMPSTQNNTTYMEIILPNVTNYDEFMDRIQKDKRFDKIVSASIGSKMTGGNSLNKFRY